jgi:hypothetical protein
VVCIITTNAELPDIRSQPSGRRFDRS